MPYLRKDQRANIVIELNGERLSPDCSGELNYVFTQVIIQYLNYKGLNYASCNDIVGALDNAKDEFRRRVQHPYEDQKIKENGDVYPSRHLGVTNE